MGRFRSYRDESRTDWGTKEPNGLLLDQITAGAILRIADATETVARDYKQLISERERYERRWREERAVSARLARSNAALRGVITRMKKRSREERGNV